MMEAQWFSRAASIGKRLERPPISCSRKAGMVVRTVDTKELQIGPLLKEFQQQRGSLHVSLQVGFQPKPDLT